MLKAAPLVSHGENPCMLYNLQIFLSPNTLKQKMICVVCLFVIVPWHCAAMLSFSFSPHVLISVLSLVWSNMNARWTQALSLGKHDEHADDGLLWLLLSSVLGAFHLLLLVLFLSGWQRRCCKCGQCEQNQCGSLLIRCREHADMNTLVPNHGSPRPLTPALLFSSG